MTVSIGGVVRYPQPGVVVPYDYLTIAEAVAACPNGGEIFINDPGEVYYTDEITIPGRDITIHGRGVIVAPNNNSQSIFKIQDSDTPHGGMLARPRIDGIKFQSRGKTGCTGIKVLECNGVELNSLVMVGTDAAGVADPSFALANGVQFDTGSGAKYCERSYLKNIHVDYCTVGIDAKATVGTLSLDHAVWDGITGNVRSPGDTGVNLESTVAHMNNSYVMGHFWLKHAGTSGAGQITGWRIAGTMGKCRLFAGFEAFDASPVNRIGVDLVSGCAVSNMELVYNDASLEDTFFTKKIKGAEQIQYGKEMGRGFNHLYNSGIVDATFYPLTVNTVASTIIGRDLRVVGPMQFRGVAGEAATPGALVYLKASDGRFYLADYRTEVESRVCAITDGTPGIGSSAYYHVPPCVVRNDAWTWTTGDILYVGIDGVLTATIPTGAGNSVIVYGVALNPTHVLVQHVTRIELS